MVSGRGLPDGVVGLHHLIGQGGRLHQGQARQLGRRARGDALGCRLQANADHIRQVFQGMAPELQAITAAAVLGNNNKQADKKNRPIKP